MSCLVSYQGKIKAALKSVQELVCGHLGGCFHVGMLDGKKAAEHHVGQEL